MGNYFKFELAVLATMLAFIALAVPLARQIISLACITFVPGILILRLLRLDLESRIDSILLSVGLSTSFLMFIGLLINESLPLVGFSEPLSTVPLSVTIAAVLLVLSILNYKKGKSSASHTQPLRAPSLGEVVRASVLTGIPILAVLGATLKNSPILLLMVALISLLVISALSSKDLVPPRMQYFAVLAMSAAILLHRTMLSRYLIGWDVFTEYHVFKLTASDSLWSGIIPFTEAQVMNARNAYEQISRINAMLSVTVLPTIYSSLMNVPGEAVFSVVFPLLFSLVPVSLYQAYRRGFGGSVAFLSVFYFMSFARFWHLISETRQMIAELFFALSILLILDEKMDARKKKLLLIAFGASMIVSHYSTTFIYMSYLAFWTLSFFFVERMGIKQRWVPVRTKIVDGRFVILFFVMAISWYTFVSTAPLETLARAITDVANSSLVDFFNLETRGRMISQAMMPDFGELTLVQIVDYVVNKVPYLLMIIGFIRILKESREEGFKAKYAAMIVPSFIIFLMVILTPNLADVFLADRFYHVVLLSLAPVCIVGGETVSRFIFDPKPYRRPKSDHIKLISVLFIAVFLFKIGFAYEITGDFPKNTSMSFVRMRTNEDYGTRNRLYSDYVLDEEVLGAIWLSGKVDGHSIVYGDSAAIQKVVRAYSGLFGYPLERSSNLTDAYVYFRCANIEGRELGIFFQRIDLNDTSKIYANGYNEVYYSPQP